MGKDKNSGKNKDVVLWASDGKEQFYDIVADNLLDCNIDRMTKTVYNGKDVIMVHETFVGQDKKIYNGLDIVFKLEGLVEIFNKYFIRKKIDLAAKKDMYNGFNSIRIYKFLRIKGGRREGEGGESEGNILLKTERNIVRDDVEIVDRDISKDKEKMVKKIEEERKLIKEG